MIKFLKFYFGKSITYHYNNCNIIIIFNFVLYQSFVLTVFTFDQPEHFQKYCNANDKGIHMYVNIINPICKSKANEFEIVDSAGIIIDNALENSIRNNNIYITISQSDSKTDFRFHLIVENPGPAVNNDFIKTIFAKGYTTKKSDTQKQKHGIGLQILKKTVNKYNGSISVYNTYRNSEGKTFIKNTIGTQRYLCMDIII